jgi:hypothetical protein
MTDTIHISVDFDWVPGSEQSVEQLFNMFQRYELRPTLFFTGGFAAANPGIVLQAKALGYEIGTHGLHHGLDPRENFGAGTSYDTQKELITRSTEIITSITGQAPKLFRAPMLKISDVTFEILCDLGYEVDSSVPAGRFDFGMGSVCKLDNINKSCKAYHIEKKTGSLLEIPPSAFILPLNMRLLRLFPQTFVRYCTIIMRKVCSPLVFYMHPAEFVSVKDLTLPREYAKGFYRDCGPHHLAVLERFFEFILTQGFRSEYMLDRSPV